jgi:hypothetical protein
MMIMKVIMLIIKNVNYYPCVLANASREFVSMLWERDDAAELVQMGQQMKL